MIEYEQWHKWALELQALAQAGLYYGSNIYDRERYERILDISAEIVSAHTETPLAAARDMFCRDTGYLTPKLDTRAAVFRDDRILLVQEASGKWALPGGWVETNCSILENAVKEVREEAGLEVSARRLIAVMDRDKHNERIFPRKIIIHFVLCEATGGSFHENSETVRTGYFPLDALPSPLALEKTTEEQIRLCFDAYHDENWQTYFD